MQLRRLVAGALTVVAACGSRTTLRGGESEPPPVACETDDDCDRSDRCAPELCDQGLCTVIERVVCDDGNVCTEDRCLPDTGICDFQPLMEDRDGDGAFGPRAGFRAGQPESCGDDCDDGEASVFPGSAELCDGLDNDCNGVIDDAADYLPTAEEAVRVSSLEHERSYGGSLAFNGSDYGLSYVGKQRTKRSYFKIVHPDGSSEPDVGITNINADSFSGPLVWTNEVFGIAWEDARQDNNYEIYFNRLDHDGNKLEPDVRVTRHDDFSVNPTLLYSELDREFLVAWDDRRQDFSASDSVGIYGQRILLNGSLVGENVLLSEQEPAAEFPSIALGNQRIGLVYSVVDGGNVGLRFRALERDLSATGPAVDLGFMDAQTPALLWARDRFVVVWDHYTTVPGEAIYGATVSEEGVILQSARRLTFDAAHARSKTLMSLGDRLLLIWADDRDGNYSLYRKLLSLDLEELSPRERITSDSEDSFVSDAAFGPNGEVGIVFWRSESRHLYFRRLACTTAP